jgi:hypothetical protein
LKCNAKIQQIIINANLKCEDYLKISNKVYIKELYFKYYVILCQYFKQYSIQSTIIQIKKGHQCPFNKYAAMNIKLNPKLL